MLLFLECWWTRGRHDPRVSIVDNGPSDLMLVFIVFIAYRPRKAHDQPEGAGWGLRLFRSMTFVVMAQYFCPVGNGSFYCLPNGTMMEHASRMFCYSDIWQLSVVDVSGLHWFWLCCRRLAGWGGLLKGWKITGWLINYRRFTHNHVWVYLRVTNEFWWIWFDH